MFSIVGLILGIIGTIIMSKGLLLKDDIIDRLSGTYWDENPHLKKKLKEDRREAMIGLTLLWAGFVLQLVDEIILFIT